MNNAAKLASRIMTKRDKGKAVFMHIQDREGQITYFNKNCET